MAIRRFLKFINYPLADSIKIPNVPERRKTVIKPHHIRNLINEIDEKVKYIPLRLKARTAILSATLGMRAEEVYKLTLDNIDLENRMIFIPAEISKSYIDRITFFSEETKEILLAYLESKPDPMKLFTKYSLRRAFEKLNYSPLRMKHMRKFFSQQSDRLGMPTAVKKTLMGHAL